MAGTSAPPLVVVTGGSSGIGLGVVRAAVADGAVVGTVSRSELDRSPHLAADLGTSEGLDRFAAWFRILLENDGAHDPDGEVVVVHSAATLTPIGPAGAVDADAYRAAVLLDSATPQILGDTVIRACAASGRPLRLVQISSGAGKHEYAGWSAYCAGKAAMDMWVRAVAAERDAEVLRVLSLSPGVVATDMQAEIRDADATSFPEVERFRELHADGALADPDQVGARIWGLTRSDAWASGDVRDLSSFD